MIDTAAVQDLVGRWWFTYDAGHFDELAELLTEDVHFSCRTDSGTTDYEEFVRADLRGRHEVMAWQRRHRLDSPYPLRHNSANLHLVERGAGEARFASYIFVTQIDGGVSALSTAVVRGVVRDEGGTLRIAALEVTLDTLESRPMRDAVPDAASGPERRAG